MKAYLEVPKIYLISKITKPKYQNTFHRIINKIFIKSNCVNARADLNVLTLLLMSKHSFWPKSIFFHAIFQTCYLNQTITVFPEEEPLTQLCMNDIISGDTSNSINQILYEGSYLDSLQEIQRISSEMNLQSLQDKLGVILNSSRIIKCHTMYNINLNIFF